MSETQKLLDAANEAMGPPRTIEPEEFESIAADMVAAVLRALGDLAEEAENGGTEWPDSGDLFLLAQGIDPDTDMDAEEPR